MKTNTNTNNRSLDSKNNRYVRPRARSIYGDSQNFDNTQTSGNESLPTGGKKYVESVKDVVIKEESPKTAAPFTLISLYELEKNQIVNTLLHFKGSKPKAAQALGVSIKTLYNKLFQYGETENFRQCLQAEYQNEIEA